MMSVISNDEVVEILYEFIKTKILILDLGRFTPDNPVYQRFERTVREIQCEIKNNKNKEDIKVVKLDQLLQEIFSKLSISDLSDLDAITDELLEALKQARDINDENDRLAQIYGGNYAFVKTYQDAVEKYAADKSEIEGMLVYIYHDIKDIMEADTLIVQGRKNFIDSIKHDVTKPLLKAGIYVKIKTFYDQILSELYTNLQLFR